MNRQEKADPLQSIAQLLGASKPASAFQGPAAAGALARGSRGAPRMQTNDLEALSEQLNPTIGYWDPLGLGGQDFWGQGNEATVGFLRHAEIKHGRVAMAAFVGFCLQSNGIVFPWKLTGDISFEDIAAAGGPPEQWDALPTAAKLQILIFIGFLETWGETSAALANDGNAHYMRGGVPGKFPKFRVEEGQFLPGEASVPHPVPFDSLYDPFNLNAEKSREELDKSLLAEINNGRLAMIGIMGLLSASKGLQVPGIDSIIDPSLTKYAGEVMGPLTAGDASLPLVDEMLKVNPVEQFQGAR
jgi:hypothetical protein